MKAKVRVHSVYMFLLVQVLVLLFWATLSKGPRPLFLAGRPVIFSWAIVGNEKQREPRSQEACRKAVCNFTCKNHIRRCSIRSPCLTCKNKLSVSPNVSRFVFALAPHPSLLSWLFLRTRKASPPGSFSRSPRPPSLSRWPPSSASRSPVDPCATDMR